jgi:hypothetical protein
MLVRPLRRMLVSSSSTSSASAVWLLASGVDLAWITRMHRMQARASARGPVTANAAQAVGFMCCDCDGLFDSSVHGISSPSHHFPGNPMCRPQQLQVIIIHWTCGHVYGDPLPHEGTLGAFYILCSMLLPQVRSSRSPLTISFVVYVVK